MFKNVAGQKVAVFAWDTVNRQAKVGDAANITAKVSLDCADPVTSNDVNPTELDATDAAGIYVFDVSQAETNVSFFILYPKSATTGISILPVFIYPVIQQTGDIYPIVTHADYGNAKLVRSTTPANALDVSATGEAGLDFANIKAASAPTTLSNITVPTVTTVGTLTTYTGNTPQTGDAFARLGAPAGASVSADVLQIKNYVDDIGAAGAGLTAIPWNAAWDAEVQSEVHDEILVNNLDHLLLTPTAGTDMTAEVADGTVISRIISNSDTSQYVPLTYNLKNLGDNVAEVHTHVGTIDGHITADYGATEKTCIDLLDDAAGGLADIHTDVGGITTELSKVPKSDGTATWNATALASLQEEANDALVANKLDHLVAVADADDVVDNSIIAKLAAKSYGTADWSTYDNTTDSHEAIRDRGDQAWLTGSGGSATSSFTTTNWTRTTGDNDGGAASDTLTVNAALFSTGEVTGAPYLQVDAVFAVTDGQLGSTIDIWGYYVGGGSHYIRVQAKDTVSALYEDIGVMALGSAVTKFTFSLSPGHTDTTADTVTIRFLHAGGSGVASHVLHIDKAQVNTQTPVISLTAVGVRQEMDSNSTQLAAIVADTNELQGEWVDGGRLDLILDIIAADTTTDIPALIAALPTDADVNAACDTAISDAALATAASVADVPTVAEFEARTIASANYATASALDAVDNFVDTEVTAIKAVTDKLDTTLVQDGAVYDFTAAALAAAPTDGAAPTVTQIRQEMDSNSTQLSAIVSDTNELQGEWVDGGRLDLILDIIAADTTTDIPALIAALPTDADVNAACDTAISDAALATAASVADVPTVTEFEARTITSANYATASALDAVDNFVDTEVTAIKAVTDKLDTTLVQDGAVYDFTAAALAAAPTDGAAPTVTQIRQEMDSNSTQLAAIKVVTDALTAASAAKLAASADTMIIGTVQAGTLSTTQATTDIALTDVDQLVGRIIIFRSNTTTAGLRHQATDITGFTVSGGLMTFTAITRAPAAGDTFVIV